MLSWSSRTNLKIVGIDGHTPDTLRDEVSRGAKFVIYSYNFSLVVMSFKRPSNVHFLRPDQNRIVKGLPFTLVSLVFGWWGIPWGIIYTIQSLHTNLTGGTDVTADILASFTPAAPPPIPGAPMTAGTAVPPALPPPPLPAPAGASLKSVALVGGVIAGLVFVVYTLVCFAVGRSMPVALVAGTPKSYVVEINGEKHQVTPNVPAVLKLPQGEFVVHGAPGASADLRFTARVPFWSRPFDQRVLVINPDATALVFRDTIRYYKTGTPVDPKDKGTYTLATNQAFHFSTPPDFFFTEFPKTVSMPAGATTVSRTRDGTLANLDLNTRISLVSRELGHDALRLYLTQLVRTEPDDDVLPQYLYSLLKPDEARAIFEAHLGERPVRVDWHRAYEYFMDRSFATVDLKDSYRRAMEKEPDDGDLVYLYARLLKDPAASHPLYERALHAKRPSAYAAYALATDAFAGGRYDDAFNLIRQAEAGGLRSASFQLRKHDILLALGRLDDALAQAHEARAKDPADAELFVRELQLAQSVHPDRAGAQKANVAFLATLRQRLAGQANLPAFENYLAARLSYALGDERDAAVQLGKVKGDFNQFEAAVDRRDHAAGEKALEKVKELPARYHWLLMLTAHAAGDAAAAEKYFQRGLATLAQADSYARDNVRRLAANTPAAHADVRLTTDYADELRVFYTALGVHFPAERDRYFARARELDRDPAFPHLLLQAVRGDATPKP